MDTSLKLFLTAQFFLFIAGIAKIYTSELMLALVYFSMICAGSLVFAIVRFDNMRKEK